MRLQRKDLLGLEDMTAEEIRLILDTAAPMRDIIGREIKKVPTLRGRTIVNLFYEPSTRTRSSFELAGKYMSADVINISTSTSSVAKGETLIDTARNLEVMGTEAVVIRHPVGGAPHFLARHTGMRVINAGDGMHEHPTQGLLDLYTIREHKGGFDGLKVAIIGDIWHSRVARSNIWGLTKLGAEVTVAGPATLIPPGIEQMGAHVAPTVEDAVTGADVVYVLRIQLERQDKGMFPSVREYAQQFGVNRRRLALAKPDALLMHPGPMNRGVEIASDIADGDQSVILPQVTNGVAVRMALLYLLLGGDAE